ncbi:unnamed protein product [Miscanthus lutarioriparius]|uniref:NIF system FeS cluster assembly NifU N-terminal domain-containing protein n=1 Tax=Miscanthus lutarioriparius TaxID=422564 RepID=A0A811NVL7_9POAL|nr:unnamed protein product [Miscanthus lutarioriparius]
MGTKLPVGTSIYLVLNDWNIILNVESTEWVKGKPMDEVLTIKNTEIAKHLSLPPVKLHCSMLAEDAIKAAVKDYEAKKAKLGQKGEDSPSEKAAEA